MINTRRRPAWFTPKSILFNDLTVALLSKIEDYRLLALPTSSLGRIIPVSRGSVEVGDKRHWWMRKYLSQHFWNLPRPSDQEVELPNPSKLLTKLRQPPIATIPVFGPGIGAAQKAIYDFVACVANAVSMHAGVRGIGTGIGVNLEGTIFKLAAIHRPPQPFHQIASTDESWKSLFRSASIYMYAVSSKLSLEETKVDLQAFLCLTFDETTVKKPPTPLFVVSFLEDQSASAVAEGLGLYDLPSDQIWAIKCVDNSHKASDMMFILKWIKSVIES
jgi:hypothetical protein